MDLIFGTPLQFLCRNPNPQWLVLAGGVPGRCLGHEGGAFVTRIGALVRRDGRDPASALRAL